MHPMPRTPLVALCLVVLGTLAGCSGALECQGLDTEECQRVADAAGRAVPPGYTKLVVGVNLGRRMPPYPVFACYPDGSQVVVEVSLPGGGARVQPLEGVELASCR